MVGAPRPSDPSGKFYFSEVVPAARGLIKGSKRTLFFWFLLAGVVGGVFGHFFAPEPHYRWGATVFFYELGVSVLSGVTVVAVTTAGLVRAAGERLTFGTLFRYMDRLPQVLLFAVPAYFLSRYLPQFFGNWVLWVLIPLSLPTALWSFFVIDRKLGPIEAVVSSYRLVLDNLAAYLKYILLTVALVGPVGVLVGLGIALANPLWIIAAFVVLFIELIWVYPFMIIAQGTMYAHAVGLERDYGG